MKQPLAHGVLLFVGVLTRKSRRKALEAGQRPTEATQPERIERVAAQPGNCHPPGRLHDSRRSSPGSILPTPPAAVNEKIVKISACRPACVHYRPTMCVRQSLAEDVHPESSGGNVPAGIVGRTVGKARSHRLSDPRCPQGFLRNDVGSRLAKPCALEMRFPERMGEFVRDKSRARFRHLCVGDAFR
jgi:hypothetical protein